MPRIKINNKVMISYDHTVRDKYWKSLSDFLISEYGRKTFTDKNEVEEILVESFKFLINKFKELILNEKGVGFFLYVFWLHNQSIQIWTDTLKGIKIDKISDSEFALYRRILKLMLEQGCDIDLVWNTPTGKEVLLMDNKIQELIYIATWAYSFADMIALQKMVEDYHTIGFDEQGLLEIDCKHHYGIAYNNLLTNINEDYKNGNANEDGIELFIEQIEKCFNIEFNWALSIINEIQKYTNSKEPELQTIEPRILPIYLANQFNISKELAETFYAGLTLSRENKLKIEDAILKPYSTQRYMFRPILVYKINSVDRALYSVKKTTESIINISTNGIHWNTIFKEWQSLKSFNQFISKLNNEHDKILESQIEDILKSKGIVYDRNIKSLKQSSKTGNIRIDNNECGEIDLIFINNTRKVVYVCEVKYNKVRYEAVGYRDDYSNFTKSYEPKLLKKVNWVKNNISSLNIHLRLTCNNLHIDLSNYDIEGIFLINTPTFYMFNGKYQAITLNKLSDFIDGKHLFPRLYIENNDDEWIMVNHPYFKKPVRLDIL